MGSAGRGEKSAGGSPLIQEVEGGHRPLCAMLFSRAGMKADAKKERRSQRPGRAMENRGERRLQGTRKSSF